MLERRPGLGRPACSMSLGMGTVAVSGDPAAGRHLCPGPRARGGYCGAAATRRPPRRLLPEQISLLNFGRVLDTTALRTEFGFTPGGRPPRRSMTI